VGRWRPGVSSFIAIFDQTLDDYVKIKIAELGENLIVRHTVSEED